MLFNYLDNEKDAESESTQIESANENSWETSVWRAAQRNGLGKEQGRRAESRPWTGYRLELLNKKHLFLYFSSATEALGPGKGVLHWCCTFVKVGKLGTKSVEPTTL